RLYNFLNEHHLLSPYQSGFRPEHSCETIMTMIDLVDVFLTNMDNGMINELRLNDCRKLFDLVDYEIMLKKLAIYNLPE
ncbi:predicted protein, partial [Nematostella vectensis]